MTPLDKPLKRQIDVEGQVFTLTLDATGVKITRKAHRNGIEVRWADLIKNDQHISDAGGTVSMTHHV
ncbi:hypothetical protein [Dyella mobilis]|uniref:Uncharacterized protein n=1 Tax=Dyella mobilis TaxID=1849582 RepID=A0ABS2KKG4_9GAMM|nr:hypothetical protein [Dyella mobilis]MBM7131655.1 hypothetical protein [Dyella mobilis]GLQ96370.1 hypothetical protein GCM10007863_07880 [Dyella mobilis]